MIQYFKYTNGETFTSNNGEPYIGFFHMENDKFYNGTLSNPNNVELIPNKTVTADIYTNQYNFNTTYEHIDQLSAYYANSFDLFDFPGLTIMLNAINNNNLICFKNLILDNPTVFKFGETGGHFYGLASILGDDINLPEDPVNLPVKINYRGNVDSLENSSYWSFLDNVFSGVVMVDTFENFKYFCTTGEVDYILSGNFISNVPLTLVSYSNNIQPDLRNDPLHIPDYTYDIYHDVINSKMVFVRANSLDIYDVSNYEECNKLLLIDQIALEPSTIQYINIWNLAHLKFAETHIKWEKSYNIINPNNTTSIKFGNTLRTSINGSTLSLSNKYSSDIYQIIELSDYNIGIVIDLDIRAVDDYVVVLSTNNIDNTFKLTFFDPSDVTGTINTQTIFSISPAYPPRVEFSEIDSDIIYTSNQKEFQTRHISAPQYPSGRLEQCDMLYPVRSKWNTLVDIFNHVELKWNSYTMNSNSFNNLTTSINISNNKMYMILHNVGRIIALNQEINDRYLLGIPLSIEKYFNGAQCSKSSLGVYLNSQLFNIIKDTLTLFSMASNSFSLSEYTILAKQLDDVGMDTLNLRMHGNESFNIIPMQRIMTNILKMQQKLLPS